MRPADAYRARHRGPSPADAYRWEIDPLVLNFHYMTKVVTRIGLDREAVGEPEGGERAFAFADRSKQMTFLAQDCIRELCAAGSSES